MVRLESDYASTHDTIVHCYSHPLPSWPVFFINGILVPRAVGALYEKGLVEQTNGRYIEPISIDYYQRLISFELIMSALSAISLDLLSSQTVKENKTGQCGCYLSQYAGFSSRIRLLCSIQTLSNGAGSLKSLSSFCPWSSVLDSPCKFNNAPRSNFGALSSLTFRMCTYCSG